MQSVSQQKVVLNNGIEMPLVGFGTYRIRSPEVIMSVVEFALAAGYRMFAPRDTHNKEMIKNACRKSLKSLGLDSVDLYLIHFPGMANIDSADKRNIKLRSEAWEALVECYNEGLVRAIGVSNYTIRHLQELEVLNFGVAPAVNQVECHPYFPQRDLLQYCQQAGIFLQAYCSLGGTSSGIATLLNDPLVTKIAQKLSISNGQLLLAWATQQGIGVIPKSTHAERIKENIMLNFNIPEEDMKALDKLGKANVKYAWDPSKVA